MFPVKHSIGRTAITTAFCLSVLLLSWGFPVTSSMSADEEALIIFSAGSTTNAVTDICRLFNETTGIRALPSFASSSTLARQIAGGAPAQVYLSANQKWMDYLEKENMILPETRINLLSNRIVLIVPTGSTLAKVAIDKGLDLAGLLGDGHLAMGDPDHVPSGIYGKKAMTFLGLWESVKGRIVRCKDVRAALALTSRAEVPLGQVYATDAAITDKVRVVGIFPQDSHPDIIYPAAIVTGQNSPEARAFMTFLQSNKAEAVFKSYGFSVR